MLKKVGVPDEAENLPSETDTTFEEEVPQREQTYDGVGMEDNPTAHLDSDGDETEIESGPLF